MAEQPKFILFAGDTLRTNETVFEFEAGEIKKLADAESIAYGDAVERYFSGEHETYYKAVPVEKPQIDAKKLIEDLADGYCNGLDSDRCDAERDKMTLSRKLAELVAEANKQVKEDFPQLWKPGLELSTEKLIAMFYHWDAFFEGRKAGFTIGRDRFRDAFMFAACVSTDHGKAVHGYVRIDIERLPDKGRIKMTGINKDAVSECSIDIAGAVVPGSMFLPYKKTLKFLELLDDETVMIRAGDKDAVMIDQGNRSAVFCNTYMGFEGWPEPIKQEWDPLLAVVQADFCKYAACVSKATDSENTQYTLGNVLLDLRPDQWNLVATCGKRMHAQWFEPEVIHVEFDERGTAQTVLLPVKALKAARSMPGMLMEISRSGDSVRFECDDYCITFKLADGKFPNWDRIIPKMVRERAPDFALPAGRILDAVRAASFFSSDKCYRLEIRLKKDGVFFSGETAGVGHSDASIALCHRDIAEKQIAVDYRFLVDAIDGLDRDKTISFYIEDAESPMALRDDEGFTAVLMPQK